MKKFIYSKKGVTLVELLVAIAVTSLVVGAAYAVFPTSYLAFRRGTEKIDVMQNSRVAADRISREIREARKIVTLLPADQSEEPAAEIKFQDGHSGQIQYIRFFLSEENLQREISHYYLSGSPDNWVTYNTPGAIMVVSEETTLAQNISFLGFYGVNVINISISAQKGDEEVNITTQAWARNL